MDSEFIIPNQAVDVQKYFNRQLAAILNKPLQTKAKIRLVEGFIAVLK